MLKSKIDGRFPMKLMTILSWRHGWLRASMDYEWIMVVPENSSQTVVTTTKGCRLTPAHCVTQYSGPQAQENPKEGCNVAERGDLKDVSWFSRCRAGLAGTNADEEPWTCRAHAPMIF
ncbi:hypothetical protein V1478_015863 [Vespula squamosa]|uniref:Uncharacterized protein n=1 Tax=Vespula squamosa TaxID=30214 RepID=A0ABD2A219_VESSQ